MIALPIPTNTQKVMYASIVFSLSFLLLGLLLVIVSINPFAKKFVNNSVASASSGSSGVLASSTKKVFMHEITIANNGLIVVQGAEVVSVSEKGDIYTTINWNGVDFKWLVQQDKLTKIFDSNGKKSVLQDIQAGSVVIVTGKLVGSDTQPIIEAEFIRIL